MSKLNPKQEKFIDEYLIDLNATQAAIRAGYSQKTAQEQASRLLSNVIISDEIKRRRETTSNKLNITRESIIEDLINIKNNQMAEAPFAAIKAIEVINKMMGYDKPVEAPQEDKTSSIEIKIIKNK